VASRRRILIENGFDPGPKRGEGTWDDFIRRHIKTLWACDFFAKTVWTFRGPVEYYVLFFIHIAGMAPNADGEFRPIPARSPNMNPHAEVWVQRVKRECLDSFVVFGERHLRHLLTRWLEYYHRFRPHQGLGNTLLRERALPGEEPAGEVPLGEIVCRESLGGDTDTIGTMAGALAGALHGTTWIPARWYERIENGTHGRDEIVALARNLALLKVDR